jgi:hypothetical protein
VGTRDESRVFQGEEGRGCRRVEGFGGSTARVSIRFEKVPSQISGAVLENGKLTIRFPAGEGYQSTRVGFVW